MADIYLLNIIYCLFIVFTIGITFYVFGMNVMLYMVFVLILFTAVSMYVIGMNAVYYTSDEYHEHVKDTRERENEMSDLSKRRRNTSDVVNVVDEMNEILKRRQDEIDKVDLSKSVLHDIDE